MKNKKYLAWIFTAKSLNKAFAVNFFLINKLCENFEKIYFINMNKFKLFKDWSTYKGEFIYELDSKFKIPKNIEIFCPNTINDFEDFIIDKEIIAINQIGRFLTDLKIHFLLKKYKIKQVQISAGGFFNSSLTPKNRFWKNLIYKINKNFSHKLVVLLSNLKLVPKIQIRFTSSAKIVEIINNSFVKKILYNLKLLYAKEFVVINSNSFDILKNIKMEVSEKKIVLLDADLNHPETIAVTGNPDKKKVEKHYYHLNKLINNLSIMYKKEIVICIHPYDNLELKKKYFPNLKVVKYESRENIYKAFLVFFFDTSAIVDALLLKKRILCIISNFAPVITANTGQHYVDEAGVLKINIEEEIKISKDKFLSKLDDAKNNYTNYINSYIVPDGNNLGYEKIIKILKERFF